MSSVQPPLKVLLLTTSFPLSKGSRSGIFIKKMIENLPAGFQITVLTPDSSIETIQEFVGFSVVRFRYAPKKWQQLAHGSGGIVAALSGKKLSCLLIPLFLCSSLFTSCWYALKVDLLHANWSINGVVAGLAGLLTGKPVVTTLRGSDVNLMDKSWLMRRLVGICLRYSKCIVTVSPSLQNVIREQFPRYSNKIKVIANGIDKSFFVSRDSIPEPSELSEPVRLLYAGNLTVGKRVKRILEAAASLSTDNWSLDIVGDGPEKKKLEEYCRRNSKASRVIFHGAVGPEEVPHFMLKADVFVFASSAEGRPNVVLEAMAAQLPVIAAAIPAVEELIEHGQQGLLFPVDDVKSLREQMEYLISHPGERRTMGASARDYIQSQGLSWQESANQYAAIYAQTAGKTTFFISP